MSHLIRRAISIVLLLFLFTSGCLAAESKTELTVYLWWGGTQRNVVQKAIDQWTAQHPGVSVLLLGYPGKSSNSMEGLVAAVAAGVPMDLVLLQAPFIQYAKPGFLQPLDPYLKAGKQALPQNYPPAIIESFKWQGKLYGLPSVEAGIGMMLFYNKELFAEAGWPENAPPKTLSELLAAQKKLTRWSPDQNQILQLGLNPMDAMGSTYCDTIWSTMFNTKWYDPVKETLNLTAFEEAADWIKQLYDVAPQAKMAAMKLPTWSAGLATRKLAMQVNGSWTPGELMVQIKDTSAFGVSWVPSSIGDKATATLPWGFGIPVTSQHPDLAYSLLDHLHSVEAQQVIFDGLGWLNINMRTLPRVNVNAAPLVRDSINMYMAADRVGAPPPLLNLMQVRGELRATLNNIWAGKVNSRSGLEDVNNRMNQALEEAKKH